MLNLDRRLQQMPQKSQFFWAAAIPAAVLFASLVVFAQGFGPQELPDALAAAAPAAPPAPLAPSVLPPTTAPTPPANPVDAKARAAALAAKANVDVNDGWTRATPANATNAAIYLEIVSAKDADKLLGAEAPAADHVEVQDAAKTAPLATIDIPAGGTVDFSPSGRHLMLVGLKTPLKEGESFLVTLKFDKAGTQNAVVKVLGANATGLPPISSTRKGDTTAGVTQR